MTTDESLGKVVALYPYSVGTDLPRSINSYLKNIESDLKAVKPMFSRRLQGTFLDTLNTSLGYTPDKYDCYIIEDAEVLLTAPLIKRRYPDSIVIYYFADHRPSGAQAYNFRLSDPVEVARYIERRIDTGLLQYTLRKYVDGVLTNSSVAADVIREVDPMPVGIVPGYIAEDVANELSKCDPSLESKTAVTIARGVETKGIDILVESWDLVRDQHPEAKLEIIGPGHDQDLVSGPGVTYHGYVEHEKLPDYLQDASLYVQPSRFDTFAVTVLEGMAAGLPAIVTDQTGAADVVEQVDPSLVTETSIEAVAEAISTYLSMAEERREELSRSVRQESRRYTGIYGSKKFVEELHRVCGELE